MGSSNALNLLFTKIIHFSLLAFSCGLHLVPENKLNKLLTKKKSVFKKKKGGINQPILDLKKKKKDVHEILTPNK